MFTSGCIALVVGVLCYSGGPEGAKVYCSDQPIPATFTCLEWNDMMTAQIEAGKRSGCMSQDGSSSSCVFTLSKPPR